jgi:hypothetical protein
MQGIVQHGHMPVNPEEERREVDPEPIGQQGERGDGGHDPALLDRRDERTTQGVAKSGLTEPSLDPQPSQLLPNRFGQARPSRGVRLFRNS